MLIDDNMTKLNEDVYFDEKSINRKVKVYFDRKSSKKFADPYTVVIGTSVFGCSADANAPNGVAQYVGELTDSYIDGWSKSEFNEKNRIKWKDVPEELRIWILKEMEHK